MLDMLSWSIRSGGYLLLRNWRLESPLFREDEVDESGLCLQLSPETTAFESGSDPLSPHVQHIYRTHQLRGCLSTTNPGKQQDTKVTSSTS